MHRLRWCVLVPTLPAPRPTNLRQRGEETPSHPGGLSEIGRQRLEEHRRSREKQRGNFLLLHLETVFLVLMLQRVLKRSMRRGLMLLKDWATFNVGQIVIGKVGMTGAIKALVAGMQLLILKAQEVETPLVYGYPMFLGIQLHVALWERMAAGALRETAGGTHLLRESQEVAVQMAMMVLSALM